LALLVSITAAQTVNPICFHQGSPQSFLIKSYALSIQGENVRFTTTETRLWFPPSAKKAIGAERKATRAEQEKRGMVDIT
jgi:hypothetical protein